MSTLDDDDPDFCRFVEDAVFGIAGPAASEQHKHELRVIIGATVRAAVRKDREDRGGGLKFRSARPSR